MIDCVTTANNKAAMVSDRKKIMAVSYSLDLVIPASWFAAQAVVQLEAPG
jgi:hypothetical protein